MKRFLTFFLIVLLPLQISLAAVHICGESIGHTSVVDTVKSPLPEKSAGDLVAGEIKDMTDSCCTVGHGCNGLHTLMTIESSETWFRDNAHAVSDLTSQLASGSFDARHERPKWAAA